MRRRTAAAGKLLGAVTLTVTLAGCEAWNREGAPNVSQLADDSSGQEIDATGGSVDVVPEASGLLIHVGKDLLEKMVTEEREFTTEIAEWQNGAWITGTNEHKGSPELELFYNPDKAIIDTLYFSKNDGRLVGQETRRRVTFWITSYATTGSRKRAYLTPEETSFLPAATNARAQMWATHLHLEGGFPFRSLILRRAWQRVREGLPAAQQRMANRLRDETNAQLDAEVPATFERMQDWRDLTNVLQDFGFGERIKYSTSEKGLRMVADREHAQATMPHPEVFASDNFVITFSSDEFNALSEARLGDQAFNRDEFQLEFGQMMGLLGGGFEPGNDSDDTTDPAPVDGDVDGDDVISEEDGEMKIKFAAEDPLTIETTAENQVIITARGTKFRNEVRVFDDPMNIKATYNLIQDDAGIRLERQNITVLPPDFDPANDRLTVRQRVLAGVLREHFSQVLAESLVKPELALPGDMAAMGQLNLSDIRVEANWLTLIYAN